MKTPLALLVSVLMLSASIGCFCAPAAQAGDTDTHAHHHGAPALAGMDLAEKFAGPCDHEDCGSAACGDPRLAFDRDLAKGKSFKLETPDAAPAPVLLEFALAFPDLVHETGPPDGFFDRLPDSPVTRHDISLQ